MTAGPRKVAAFRRRVEFWGRRYAAAATAQDRARVAWDHVRARIRILPEDRQDSAWRTVAELLGRVAPDRSPVPAKATTSRVNSRRTATGERGHNTGAPHARARVPGHVTDDFTPGHDRKEG